MKATAWDKIITSAPLNADAAKARDGKGTHWTPDKKLGSPGQVRGFAPPAMKPLPPQSINLIGFKVGKLTVVGLAAKGTSDGAAWVVRCVCGYYETRKAKALRSPAYAATGRAMCVECDYLEELKAGRVIRPTVAERMQKQKNKVDGGVLADSDNQGTRHANRLSAVSDGRSDHSIPATADG